MLTVRPVLDEFKHVSSPITLWPLSVPGPHRCRGWRFANEQSAEKQRQNAYLEYALASVFWCPVLVSVARNSQIHALLPDSMEEYALVAHVAGIMLRILKPGNLNGQHGHLPGHAAVSGRCLLLPVLLAGRRRRRTGSGLTRTHGMGDGRVCSACNGPASVTCGYSNHSTERRPHGQ
jgi:hypothetical protein